MNFFFAILFLNLFFIIPSQANDISDFEIEGISINESLLDFFNQNNIQSSRKYEYKDDKFYTVDIWSDKFKEFDLMQFHLKKDDENYKIYGFAGALSFGEEGKYSPESEKKCITKKKKIENDLESLFSKANRNSESGIGGLEDDPKVIRHDTYIFLDNGDVWLQCYTFSKENKKKFNLIDNLRITILSIEFKKWINTKAY